MKLNILANFNITDSAPSKNENKSRYQPDEQGNCVKLTHLERIIAATAC